LADVSVELSVPKLRLETKLREAVWLRMPSYRLFKVGEGDLSWWPSLELDNRLSRELLECYFHLIALP
jgi:hypothetical protein